MHIMEGFLPASHALFWGAASAPFVIYGGRRIITLVREKPETKMLMAASGAYVFVLSALKIPRSPAAAASDRHGGSPPASSGRKR